MTLQQQAAIIDEKVVEAIIQKAMQGKDHFDDNDFIYAAMMTPNLRCTEDQAEQTLYALLEEEGKRIEEFEPGKYHLKLDQVGGA